MAPKNVLWEYQPHTEAKHDVLRWYLDARVAIMGQATGFPELVMVDGFAGPGRYLGGEKGSPLLMLDAFLEHRARQSITARLRYIFIERDERRFAYLEAEIDAYRPLLPHKVAVELYNDPFDERMDVILRDLGAKPPPVFTFVDPFGISDNHREVTSRVLGHGGCEVLAYVPLYQIARFIRSPEFERHLDNLFSGESWRDVRNVHGLQERITLLKAIFEEAMSKTCNRVMTMEIPSERANAGYFLFFGTSHDLGVEKMKDVFWRVDPLDGSRYHPTRKSVDELLLPITATANVGPLKHQLFERFGLHEFSIEDALSVTFDSRFKPTHLRGHVLGPLEAIGAIEVDRPAGPHRVKTYPAATTLRFTRPPILSPDADAGSALPDYRADASVGA